MYASDLRNDSKMYLRAGDWVSLKEISKKMLNFLEISCGGWETYRKRFNFGDFSNYDVINPFTNRKVIPKEINH